MQEAIRGADAAYRIGGDEFAIILDGTGARRHAVRSRLRLAPAASAGHARSGRVPRGRALTFGVVRRWRSVLVDYAA
jgi:GGDEF domain-containing protein